MGLVRALTRRRSGFVGNVAILLSGKATAGVVALVTMPIISRLFTPADFGVTAVFVALIGMISTGASLRYDGALVLPKEHDEAMRLMGLAHHILFTVCALLWLLILVYELSGIGFAGIDLLGAWIWVLPLGVLLASLLMIQESWLTRQKAFKLSSVSLVVGNGVTGVTRIGFGAMAGSTIWGLITGYLIGLVSRLAIQKAASRDGVRAMLTPIDWPVLKTIAARYADFPKLNLPASVIFGLGRNLPVLLFGAMFSPAIAGFYGMANRLTRIPMTSVSNSLRRVFIQRIASIRNQGGRGIKRVFLLTTGVLAALGLVPCIALWYLGEPLAVIVLGDDWQVAGRYLEIMAPWLFIMWVTAPCNPVFVVLRAQKLWLWLTVWLTALRLGAFGVAWWVGAGPEETLQGFVAVTVVGNAAIILTALWLTDRYRGSLATDIDPDDVTE